ncbi:MAG: DUF4352 domain-containing protein [Ktedonobacteraceae bacterium]
MQYPPNNNPQQYSQPPNDQPQQPQYPPQQWQQQNTQYSPQQQPEQWQQPMYQPPPQSMSPFQQPPVQPQKKKSKPGLILAVVAGVLLLACVIAGIVVVTASKSANTGTSVSSNNSSTTTTTAPTTSTSAQHFQVGQTVKVGDTWQITINSAKTDNGGQFSTLKSGDEYLNLNITAKNISSQEQNISSAVQFTLTDITGQKYDETIDLNAGATLDGKVEAGSQLKGNIAYEVPKSVHSFQMAFEVDIISSGQTIWDVKV